MLPLSLIGFLGFLNIFGLTPFFANIADDLDVSVSVVGYSSTAGLLTTAIAGLLIAPIVQKVGGRRLLLAGMVLVIVSAIMTMLAPNYSVLIVSRVVAGIAGAITNGVTVGIVAEVFSGRARRQGMAIVAGSIAMAVVVGVVLLTSVATLGDWRTAYLGLAITSAIALVVASLAIPATAGQGESRHSEATVLETFRHVFKDMPTTRLMVASAMHSGSLNGFTAFTGAFMVAERGAPTGTIGLIFSVLGAGYVVGNVLGGRIPTTYYRAIFAAGIASMGPIWTVAFLIETPIIVTIILLGTATFGAGLSWVALLSMLTDYSPVRASITMLLNSSMLSVGAAAGTGIASTILASTGYTGLAIGMAIIAAGAGLTGLVPPLANGAGQQPPPTRSSRASAGPDWPG